MYTLEQIRRILILTDLVNSTKDKLIKNLRSFISNLRKQGGNVSHVKILKVVGNVNNISKDMVGNFKV